jgi:formylglycine-generating enzyme required for sulfatase activity
MVEIPSGQFLMGAPESEPESGSSERPQHEVKISEFCMSRYPITQKQWKAVAAMPRIQRDLELDPSNFKGNDLPVENVSWYEAVEFCERLTKATGRKYRLPSEAEWEYACRAGSTTPFHFGETITTDVANYDGNYTYNNSPKGEYRNQTTPVDHFEVANAFGLSDMHGNVWEWCADQWHKNYEGAPEDGRAWTSNPTEGESYILRGGSWYYYPWLCRAAYRYGFAPVDRISLIGFRVCCSLPRTY